MKWSFSVCTALGGGETRSSHVTTDKCKRRLENCDGIIKHPGGGGWGGSYEHRVGGPQGLLNPHSHISPMTPPVAFAFRFGGAQHPDSPTWESLTSTSTGSMGGAHTSICSTLWFFRLEPPSPQGSVPQDHVSASTN